MFITKQELKQINVGEAFDQGTNFIKITNGSHTIFRINGNYKVENHRNNQVLRVTSQMPKYIRQCL